MDIDNWLDIGVRLAIIVILFAMSFFLVLGALSLSGVL